MPAKRTAPASKAKPKASPAENRPTGVLEIDLGAIQKNWRSLQARVGKAVQCAAVVKADGYGLGGPQVGKALAAVGCKLFFVATIEEALALRAQLKTPEIAVLNGLLPGNGRDFLQAKLIPVLNDLGQLDAWRELIRPERARPPAILHLDTGMNRLGLSRAEAAVLADDPGRLAGVTLRAIVSHLVISEDPKHAKSAEQRRLFLAARRKLPPAPAALANSSGIFLGADYHFDFVRPGAALYGINPLPGQPNPMSQVVRLKGKIVQVRDVDRGETVGYGARHRMERGGRIATVAVGYADGWFRSSSGRAMAGIGGKQVAAVGPISMDLMTLDVTGMDPALLQPGAFVDLIDAVNTPDVVGERAGTIGYEVLTTLGRRYRRVYLGG
ncbi:MAG TPA: alanine racemase [Stellaceae bacterium]|nr:alanine racemase [Stellaceae bacterium]